MRRIPLLFFLMLLTGRDAMGQIVPAEGKLLNYRLVGFKIPAFDKADHATISVAMGTCFQEDSFSKKKVQTFQCHNNKVVAELPSFGAAYTWRAVYYLKGKVLHQSPLHRFSTMASPGVDSTLVHLRIGKQAHTYRDAYVLLDGAQVMYNMRGEPVWFLPDIEKTGKGNADVRDLKANGSGTITFLMAHDKAFEINYNGDILWQGPNDGKVSGDTSEFYHHELTKIGNGHYMVMGMETVGVYFKTAPGMSGSGTDTSLFVGRAAPGTPGYIETFRGAKFQIGTVIEYDKAGHVAWDFKASKYFTGSDLVYRRLPNGWPNLKPHSNGFFLDEKKNELYISFKDIGRVIRIKYPEGDVLATYGENFSPGTAQNMGKGYFCGQHNCRCSQEGYLYLFNNNDCNWPVLPTIVMMQQPEGPGGELKKVWEYQCTIEDTANYPPLKLQLSVGGSVFELPDRSIFASMSSRYSKIFIVNRNKEILWSAYPEKWNSFEKKWQLTEQYRASIITDRNVLERLVFGETNP